MMIRINAINYYSPTVFKSIGITGTNTSLFTTGLFGVVKTVFTIVYLVFLVDQFGRRRLLMIGALGGSLCLWYVGGYIAVAKPAEHPTKSLPPSGVSAIFFFYLWTVSLFFATLFAPLTNIFKGFLLPNMEPYPLGAQLRDVRSKRTNPRSSLRCCQQLVLELYRRALYASDVR